MTPAVSFSASRHRLSPGTRAGLHGEGPRGSVIRRTSAAQDIPNGLHNEVAGFLAQQILQANEHRLFTNRIYPPLSDDGVSVQLPLSQLPRWTAVRGAAASELDHSDYSIVPIVIGNSAAE